MKTLSIITLVALLTIAPLFAEPAEKPAAHNDNKTVKAQPAAGAAAVISTDIKNRFDGFVNLCMPAPVDNATKR